MRAGSPACARLSRIVQRVAMEVVARCSFWRGEIPWPAGRLRRSGKMKTRSATPLPRHVARRQYPAAACRRPAAERRQPGPEFRDRHVDRRPVAPRRRDDGARPRRRIGHLGRDRDRRAEPARHACRVGSHRAAAGGRRLPDLARPENDRDRAPAAARVRAGRAVRLARGEEGLRRQHDEPEIRRVLRQYLCADGAGSCAGVARSVGRRAVDRDFGNVVLHDGAARVASVGTPAAGPAQGRARYGGRAAADGCRWADAGGALILCVFGRRATHTPLRPFYLRPRIRSLEWVRHPHRARAMRIRSPRPPSCFSA
ncbi:conserved hypothetical protein [Burkholderia cenocepacia]|nr:conserved hypothetical protein [Burkholderia cenocepacia]